MSILNTFQNFLSNKTNLFLVLSISFYFYYFLSINNSAFISSIYDFSYFYPYSKFEFGHISNCISIFSFKKTKSKNFLLTSLSFSILLIVEFLYLLQSSNILGDYHIPFIEIEIPHLLLLFMLTLFAVGVIRVERR